MRIGVHGGEREGDDIRIRGNTTLRLFAEERPVPTTPEDTSESSSSEQVEVRFSSDTSPARGPLYGQAPEGRLDVECDLAVGYANWGEQPDLPPLSASLLDSTLPAGHSWNIGAEEDEHPAPDNETEPPVPADQDMEAERPAAAPSTLLNALVYIPDYVPEVLEVRVDLPIGIRDFVDVVQQLRFADQIAGFPHLCPVTPQPLCEMAIFVAAPTWLTDLVVVLMDCRLTQSGLFARTVHSRLNRESILVAAGFRHDDAISVHIEGRIRPLGIDERVALTHGHTIHFVPRYTDVPRCFELADMLLTSQGWDPEAPMPGIQSHLNSHFLILSDAGPFTLAITPRSFVDFKGVVAEAVGVAEHRLYTKVSVPQIKDSYRFGFWASGVIVATDRLSSIPCPPAAKPETRKILILDQRRILRGFAWQTVEGCFVDVQSLADSYYGLCPLSHVVTFQGATVEHRDGQRVFSIVNGQVITVEFTREQDPSSSDSDHPPHLSPPPDVSDVPGDNDPATEHRSNVDRGTPGVTPGHSLTRPSARSRSPRQRAGPQNHPLVAKQAEGQEQSTVAGRLPVHLLQTCLRSLGVQIDNHGPAKFAGVHVNKWSLATLEHAHVVSKPGLTPIPWTHLHPDHCARALCPQECFAAFGAAASAFLQSSIGFLGCKLLREPASGGTRGSGGLDRAREATRLLGGPWPFPPYRWPILVQEEEADPMDVDTDERFMVDISVYLLTPDYTAEHLPLTVQLPQTLQEIEELVQTCREADRRALFPTLIEVRPQPDPGWGIFLAVPAWASQRAVICCDLSFFDGRIIAVSVPPLTDSFSLCASVGLAPRAEVDIFLPGAAAPLPPGGEVFLQSGTCVAFVRPGARRHVTFDLQLMLRSHLGWEHSPVFPHATLDCDGYCVASCTGQFLFRLLPNRAMYYRSDIALLTGLHPTRVVVTPATPQPGDVCVCGWECRALVAATDRATREVWNGSQETPVIGFLDCRPLLIGWMPVFSWDPWLPLEPIKQDLDQSAPVGWHTVFPQLPPHWTWTCWSAGQILVVAFAPDGPPQGRQLTSGPPCEPCTSDPSAGTGSEDTQQTVFCPAIQVPGATRGTVDLCHRLFLALAFVTVALPVLLQGDLGLSMLACGSFLVHRHRFPAVFLYAFACGSATTGDTAMAVQIGAKYGAPIEVRQAGEISGDPTSCAVHPVGELDIGQRLRTIATPCRASVPGPVMIDDHPAEDELPFSFAMDSLVTLLEESAWDTESRVFFEASTLLEVLFEHFGDPVVAGECENKFPPAGPPTLLLSEHFTGPPCHDVSSVALRLDTGLDQTVSWFQQGRWALQASLPDGLVMPTCAKDIITCKCPSFWMPGATGALQVFTDGSFDGFSCSWAFCVLGHQNGASCLLGWAAGQVPEGSSHPLYVSPARASAICGEQYALFWAAVWCMQSPAHPALELFSDCLVALNQVTGLFGWNEGETMAPICRAAMQALLAGRPTVKSQVQHVRSHEGTPANELADSLAKFANKFSGLPVPDHCRWVAQQVRAGALPWLWLQVEATLRPEKWPVQVGSSLVDRDRHTDSTPFTREECYQALGLKTPEHTESTHGEMWGRLHCITVNVQSLAESQEALSPEAQSGFTGRARYLREQLQSMGVHVAALQEARSSVDTTYVSDTHVRFCTARDPKGNFGCELWFSRTIPFVSAAGTQAFFHPNDFLTVASGPRELLVRFSRAGTQILFICIHAPVGGSPEREKWWKELRHRIRRFSRNALVFLAGDFNTGFHYKIPLRVGDLVWSSAHGAPAGLEGILADQDLWIPSTFSQCHTGNHDTWLSPSGTTGARLDYFAVAASWFVPDNNSWVDTSLDWGQSRVDHFGLGLVVLFPLRLGKGREPQTVKFDREALHTEDGRCMLASICEHIPLQPWTSNVHRHYAQIEAHISQALSVAFPSKRGVCRSSHFSAATWDLRQRRSWLRKQIARASSTFGSLDLKAAFLGLKSGIRLRAGRVLAILRGLVGFRSLHGLVQEMRMTKGTLRHHIRQDINNRVRETAALAATSSKSDVVSRLRPLLGPPKRKVRQRRALHGICHPNGEPTQTPAEAEDVWIRHFAGIEDGEKIDPLQLVENCHLFQSEKDLDAYELTTGSLPTRTELEQSLRSTQTNRAIGLDRVPGELLHFAAGQVSVPLFQLFLKVSMRAAEPIQFKGGALFAIWKGKSSATQCSAHRGILVSSTPGKSFHRVARQRAIPALQNISSDMQIGGLPHFPVTMASHFFRAFQEGCAQRKRSYGLLFLDLREAFYRVVRPLLTGTSFCDEAVAQVVKSVRLPPGIMHELHKHLHDSPLPAAAGATEWLLHRSVKPCRARGLDSRAVTQL